MNWIDRLPKYLFFTGKGGVGKTSLASATAVRLADEGERVLLVSTDPASNLEHVFGVKVDAHKPTPVPEVPGLELLNIDPEEAVEAYRERVVGPVRGVLPEKSIRGIEEQLSGACTMEIAAFDEFTELLTLPEKTSEYKHVVFDTAPTGHTLRLLQLPSAWSGFLESNQSGASCLGPLAGLERQQSQYSEAVSVLSDLNRVRMILVSRLQESALQEAARTSKELLRLGIANQQLILNAVMPETASQDPLARSLIRRERQAEARMPEALRSLPTNHVRLQPNNLVGVAALRSMFATSKQTAFQASTRLPEELPASQLGEMVDQIAATGHGLIMVMGKGGVGKTTLAAAVAVDLAQRGFPVHLTTTDPAAHVIRTVDASIENLEVSRIDPEVETERYRKEILTRKGKNLDAEARALLEEDLRSPCTEEIAVFQAFSRAIRESQRKFVVVDTAPTGHTLLLLDATGAYHRDVVRSLGPDVKTITPLMRLQDPEQTKILIVTLPETTPVLEASQLQEDLRRAGIEPWAWVVNASLAAARPSDSLLARRALAELPEIKRVADKLAKRTALVPLLTEEPVGPLRLRALVGYPEVVLIANSQSDR